MNRAAYARAASPRTRWESPRGARGAVRRLRAPEQRALELKFLNEPSTVVHVVSSRAELRALPPAAARRPDAARRRARARSRRAAGPAPRTAAARARRPHDALVLALADGEPTDARPGGAAAEEPRPRCARAAAAAAARAAGARGGGGGGGGGAQPPRSFVHGGRAARAYRAPAGAPGRRQVVADAEGERRRLARRAHAERGALARALPRRRVGHRARAAAAAAPSRLKRRRARRARRVVRRVVMYASAKPRQASASRW